MYHALPTLAPAGTILSTRAHNFFLCRTREQSEFLDRALKLWEPFLPQHIECILELLINKLNSRCTPFPALVPAHPIEQELSELPFESEIEEQVAAAAYLCVTICSIFVILKRHLLAYHRFVKPDARMRERAKDTAKNLYKRVAAWMPIERKNRTQAKTLNPSKFARGSTGAGSFSTHRRGRSWAKMSISTSLSARDLLGLERRQSSNWATGVDQMGQLQVVMMVVMMVMVVVVVMVMVMVVSI